MRAIIVGHGPSMLEQEYGGLIDSYDVVIRQKRCNELMAYPALFGTRTDIVCGSFTIASELPKKMPGCTYWAFMDSRHTTVPDETVQIVSEKVPCVILRELCDEWNHRYREARKGLTTYEGQESKPNSDGLGIASMSSGLHTLVYACAILKPDQIDLIGFDNIKTGGFTWSVTRGPDWKHYPDHNWATEHELIPVIADHFKVRVEFV